MNADAMPLRCVGSRPSVLTDQSERDARMVLSRVVEPGDPEAGRLVHELSAAVVLERLQGGRLASPKASGWMERLGQADADGYRRIADRIGARYVVPGDDEWPDQLDDLDTLLASEDRRAAAPFGLWVRGPLSLAEACRRSVAVVGARDSTAYGDHVASDISAGCSYSGYLVISGGAYGIDAAAHRGALTGPAASLAVLACGIDRLYPTVNSDLLTEIAGVGLLVSEAAPGCVPTKSRFLVRNRLIAALSQGTVVVEAAVRSGSLNTARWARDLGRGVMGVPGPVTSALSVGVHELLRQPETVLVTDHREVIDFVGPIGEAPAPVRRGSTRPRDQLDDVLRQLLDAVPRATPAAAASIARAAGMAPADVNKLLEELAGRGLVVRADAARWCSTGRD